MHAKDFYQELKNTKDWKLDTHGHIRKRSSCSKKVCPICAVANKKLRKVKFDTNADKAAEYLGLNKSFVRVVINASDNRETYKPNVKNTRNKLLRTLKLS